MFHYNSQTTLVSFLQIVVLKKLCYCKTYCKNYMGALETLDRLVYLINVATSMVGTCPLQIDWCIFDWCIFEMAQDFILSGVSAKH